jgi:hypothetical protein
LRGSPIDIELMIGWLANSWRPTCAKEREYFLIMSYLLLKKHVLPEEGAINIKLMIDTKSIFIVECFFISDKAV